MSRKKIISKKENYQHYKDILAEIQQDEVKELTSTQLIEYAGGSISNLPVNTKEFKSWLGEQQEINPLIGKQYLMSAPEYNTDEVIKETKFVSGEERQAILSSQNKEYNPDDITNQIMIEMDKSITEESHDMNFIDMTIIENTVRTIPKAPLSDIIKACESVMRKYHDNESYVTSIPMEDVIYQTLLLNDTLKEKLFLK